MTQLLNSSEVGGQTAGQPVVRRFWTHARVNKLCVALILGTIVGIPLAFFQTKDNFVPIRMGSDFPPIYASAMIVQQGQGRSLYDLNLYRRIELDLCHVAPETFGCIVSPYPPFVAVFLLPLTLFSVEVAKWIYVGVMAFFLILAVWFMAQWAPIFKQNWLAVIAFFIFFQPVQVAVFNAQNTALSMMLYAGVLWGLSRGNTKGDFGCGIFLGLWLFKPQYALPMTALLVFSRSWRILAGVLTIGGVYYLIGSSVSGFLWPIEWIQALGRNADVAFQIFQGPMISIPGTLNAACAVFGGAEKSIRFFAVLLGYGIAALLFFRLALKFLAAGRCSKSSEKRGRLQSLLELAGPMVLLTFATVGIYDLGVCVVSCARHVRLETDRQITLFIVFIAVVTLAALSKEWFAITPLCPILLGVYIYLACLPEKEIIGEKIYG